MLRKIKYALAEEKRLWGERLRSRTTPAHPDPLLIFGNQKSGTSAIAGLLGAATGQEARIDFVGGWEPFLTPLVQGKTPVAKFVRKNSWAFSAPIVKEPGLTFVSPQLLDHFGGKKGLFIIRESFQNIRSIFNRLDLAGDLESYTPTRHNLPNRTWLSILSGSDLGFEPAHYVEIQARRWSRAAEIYLSAPERYELVRYEDFVADKPGTIRDLAQRFGITPDQPFEHMLNHSFQKAGKPKTDPKAFFGANYDRVVDICGPLMSEFGYSA